MFGKNLRYYRLKRGLSQTELAQRVGVRSAAISNYEKGKRLPETEIIRKMAEVLQVRVSDFLVQRNEDLRFENVAFQGKSGLSRRSQELTLADTEEYFSRFFDIVEILGGDVLPKVPRTKALELSEDFEEDAKNLREYLDFPSKGPLRGLIGHLEDHGILFLYVVVEEEGFAGVSGTVNGIPFLTVNHRLNPEKIRRIIVQELIRLYFNWPDFMHEKETDKRIKAIAGAFLFPKADAVRELGIKRTKITSDMVKINQKYGISFDLLVDRAWQCGIVSQPLRTSFHASHSGICIEESICDREEPALFEHLVLRAVAEEEISVQKGAELLQKNYTYVLKNSEPLSRDH